MRLVDIYLIQHAEAKPKEIDPEQPLTDVGICAIEKIAEHILKLKVELGEIYHSGKLRSIQTAKILAERLGAMERVKMRQGLEPLDDVKRTVDWLKQQELQGIKSITIIGHLPFLGKLASILLTCDESAGVISFHHAGIVKLASRSDGRGFVVDWILTPELVSRNP